ncbi:MAG: branched-chain amino acid aminotransferase [Nocardioidaceae bacterium]
MTSSPQIRIEPNPTPTPAQRRTEILQAPGFGKYFTDHMVLGEWTPDAGWHDLRVQAYGPLSLDPATAVLHYAQEIFEGLKAYAHDDGSVWTFRPRANAARFQRSAARLALPSLPEDTFVDAIDALLTTDRPWIPTGAEMSLYVRPFMYASEVFLGVRPSKHVTFGVIASPAGAYFSRGPAPVSIWLSEHYSRAGAGGTGSAKCGGNYAASLIAQREASEHGCDQVVFVDASEHRWVEELGGMNIFFVLEDGTVVTPALTGSILEGITRDSVLTIAADLGHKVDERRVAADEWRDGVASGRIAEVFACGTAAVVTAVGSVRWNGGEAHGDDEPGPVTASIRRRLLDIQYGRAAHDFGWMHRVA